MIITRRQFLKYCSVAAGALGLSASTLTKLEKAYADFSDTAPNVVYLTGQDCSGCITSLLNTAFYANIAPVLLDTVDLCFESEPFSISESAEAYTEFRTIYYIS